MNNFLGRIVAIVTGTALFVGAFVLSIAFFAVVLAVGVILGGYFLWKTRHLRKHMHRQHANREVIEGTVISSEEVR